MNKHTPGPWRIGNLGSYDAHTDEPYRNVWAGEGVEATVVAQAVRTAGAMTNNVDEDARLIAAAPDLLAALQGLLRGIFDGPDEANAAMLIAKARDAVNKATGEN